MSSTMPLKNYIDDALTIVGYGRWQIPFFLLAFLVQFLLPVHMVVANLVSVPIPFRCLSSPPAPPEAASDVLSPSTTTSQPLAVTYDSRCGAIEQNVSTPQPLLRNTDLPSCSFVEYDHSIFPSTIISEFHLVCERSFLRPLFQMLACLGVLVGAPLGGVISDKYGRKTIVFAGAVVNAVGVVVMAVSPWYWTVLLSRFILGLTASLFFLPSFSLAQETTPPRFRSQSGMLVGLGFSVGIVVLAGVAVLVRPWRYLLLTAPSILLVIIPLAWWVEESPRWLAQNGRHKEAAEALEGAARRNRVTITPELVAVLEKLKAENSESDAVEEHDKKEGLSALQGCFGPCLNYLRYPGLRRIVLVMPFIWYLQGLLYLGIILNANNFTSNDPFVYVAVSGVMDFSAIVLTTPLTMRFGRRCLSTILFFFSGTLLLLDIAIPAEFEWMKWIFVMTAFLLSSASYQILVMYTPELFPTVIRSRGFGLVSGLGSLGLLTAPIITDLLVQKVWWAVNVVCGAAGLLNSLLITLLPETQNLPLPETVQDVERLRLASKGKKYSERLEEPPPHEAGNTFKTEPLLNVESQNSNLEIVES